uniref:Ig-like domain-containing protein n=1 Tax=Chelydra serpentina TaxID=8475 RepID=A0A8C3SHD2_CHESE
MLVVTTENFFLGVWLVSLAHMLGVHAQPTLTQPASESVALGGTIKLSCTMSSGTSISGYFIYWFQQTAGNPPRKLLYYRDESSKQQASGVPARFSASKDTSSNICYLTISGIQAEDDADYYCLTLSAAVAHRVRKFGLSPAEKETKENEERGRRQPAGWTA